MKNRHRATALIAVAIAVVTVVMISRQDDDAPAADPATTETAAPSDCGTCTSACPAAGASARVEKLPRLLDLGSDQCVPCKQMAPILEELARDWSDCMIVELVDVRKDPKVSEKYGIRVIPTQLFFDAEGRELFRHEGFISREGILSRWKELGMDMTSPED